MKNKLFLSLALIALVLGVGISVAYAYPENRQEMKRAIENNDYQAWEIMMNEKVDLMSQRLEEMKRNINQERFEQMKEVHGLMQEGKYDEARQLKEELGFGGFGQGMRWNHMK